MKQKKKDIAKLQAAELKTKKTYKLAENETDRLIILAIYEPLKDLIALKYELEDKINNPGNFFMSYYKLMEF